MCVWYSKIYIWTFFLRTDIPLPFQWFPDRYPFIVLPLKWKYRLIERRMFTFKFSWKCGMYIQYTLLQKPNNTSWIAWTFNLPVFRVGACLSAYAALPNIPHFVMLGTVPRNTSWQVLISRTGVVVLMCRYDEVVKWIPILFQFFCSAKKSALFLQRNRFTFLWVVMMPSDKGRTMLGYFPSFCQQVNCPISLMWHCCVRKCLIPPYILVSIRPYIVARTVTTSESLIMLSLGGDSVCSA